jgi:ABC-type lipoprotein export system ATPase subunit
VEAPSPGAEPAPAEAFIRFDRVSRRYQMGATPVDALEDVSLTIERGTFATVVGPSGSGKSTLLHLLAAMDRPTQGQIQVGDWDLGTLDRTAQAAYRRTMVGMIFQQFHLIPTMTAQENVALPLILAGAPEAERQERAAEALALVDLADRRTHRPAELSGGEQQRVATARALVHDPPVLLADEPTGNLDSDTGAQIIGLLEELHDEQDRTIIVVTHHFAEVEHAAERVFRLRDGRLQDDVSAAA